MWKLFQHDKRELDDMGFRFARRVLAGKKIVIADDHGSTLKWLKYTLEAYFAEVFVFKHGQETIDFLQKANNDNVPADALILDIHMNSIGGLEIARFNSTMAHPAFAMFLTGCREDSEEYKKAETMSVVLQKPVDMEKILQVLLHGLVSDFDLEYEAYAEEQKKASVA
jgi:CheY-like chemotaxis protein